MKKTNEDGVTLVELLAALVLMSIVGAIIWNTVFISMRYSTTETKKLRLQQEANYVITEIQRYHRQCNKYNMTIHEDKISIKNCERDSSNLPDLVINNTFQYSSSPEFHEDIDDPDAQIEPKTSDLSFTLTIKDAEKTNLEVNIHTVISRYKGNE